MEPTESSHNDNPFIVKAERFDGLSTSTMESLISAKTDELAAMGPYNPSAEAVIKQLDEMRAPLIARRETLDIDDPQANSLDIMINAIDIALTDYSRRVLDAEPPHRPTLEN